MLGRPLVDGGLPHRDDERSVNRRRLVGASLAGLALAVTRPGHPARAAGNMVEVPTYSQQRNLSCEYAAAVIAMAAYGTWVSEWAFDDSPSRSVSHVRPEALFGRTWSSP